MFEESLDPFFQHWGELVLIAGNSVECLFDVEFAAALEVEGATLQAWARSADLAAISHGSPFVRYPGTPEETEYSVVGIQPDGTGATTLILQEV